MGRRRELVSQMTVVDLVSKSLSEPDPLAFVLSGSHEMIDNYWSKLGGKPNKGPQKRGATSATGSKRRRAEDSPTGNGAGPSKRGRRNNAVPAVTDQEEDPEADELSAFSKDHKESMAPYADYASWEEHVKSIETIERGANDKLVVYMIM